MRDVRRAAALGALALFAAAPAAAQDAGPPRVGRVELVREDIFAGDARGLLPRLANALHARTHAPVVRREVLLRAGEPFDSARAAETLRNLRALGLFRRVRLDTVRAGDTLVARVVTRDGWSTEPVLELERAAGQTAFSLGVIESNALGWGGAVTLRYRDTPDRTSWLATWRQPRLVAGRVGVAASVDARSDGTAWSASVGQPFFALASRWSATLAASDFDGDVLRFRDGDPVPAVVLRRRVQLLTLEGAHAPAASPRGYVRAGLVAQLRRDDAAPAPLAAPLPATVTGAAGAWVEWTRARFAVLRNVQSFLREEDVNLSPAVRLTALAAPRAFGYDDDGVGLALAARGGVPVPSGVALASVNARGRLAGGGLDSGSVRLRGEVILQPHPHHAIRLVGSADWQRAPAPGAEVDYGLGTGFRAYPAHAFTGDRAVLAGGEYRWTVRDDLLGVVGIGVAAFAAHGGAWFAGAPRRTGTELGAGLRLGSSRTASGEVLRIDAAWRAATDRLGAGWSLVVGQGVPF